MPILPERRFLIVFLVLGTLLAAAPARAQEGADSSHVRGDAYTSGMGFQLLLTNSGFGLGGYYRHGFNSRTSLHVDGALVAGKDGREARFFSYNSRSTIPNKANYFLMAPLHLGIQHRLFQEQIEDNFRPYLQITVGPTLGWEYPYFRDCDGDGKLNEEVECERGFERAYDSFSAFPRGHLRAGFGGMLALGANFGTSTRMSQGVRIGYGFSYFFREIQLLEPDIARGARRFFGTPTITLMFGRLF